MHRHERIIMTDANALRREIGTAIEPDRAATDASLQEERAQADTAIEERTQEKLEHTRAVTDESAEANGRAARSAPANALPEVYDELVTAAETLAGAAEGLARAVPAKEPAPVVADNLSAVAESLGIAAANLAEERKEVDAAVREERARVDEKLRAERKFVNEALQEEREAKRTLLEAERIMTDRDLARERDDTDRAVEYTVSLLQEEQEGHRRALDVIISRDDYLSIVSHDLRTPLNIISVSASLLADHPKDEARVKECTQNISRAAALMGRMLSDLLDATRFEEGRFRLSPRHQDSVEVVKECAASFAPLAHAAGLMLRVDTPASAVYARFDYDRIIQVLSNLLRNAIQFASPGGTITVSVTEDHGGARISVSDSGKGIAAANLERIFDRFFQAGEGDRRGLGLGLYISKAIIEAHGGRIWAASQPGHGSTFSFTLPA